MKYSPPLGGPGRARLPASALCFAYESRRSTLALSQRVHKRSQMPLTKPARFAKGETWTSRAFPLPRSSSLSRKNINEHIWTRINEFALSRKNFASLVFLLINPMIRGIIFTTINETRATLSHSTNWWELSVKYVFQFIINLIESLPKYHMLLTSSTKKLWCVSHIDNKIIISISLNVLNYILDSPAKAIKICFGVKIW